MQNMSGLRRTMRQGIRNRRPEASRFYGVTVLRGITGKVYETGYIYMTCTDAFLVYTTVGERDPELAMAMEKVEVRAMAEESSSLSRKLGAGRLANARARSARERTSLASAKFGANST